MAVSAIAGLVSAATTSSTALLGGFLLGGTGTFLTHFLVTTALGAALNALSPKPRLSGANRGYQVTQKGSALDHQVIFGEVKIGGVVVYESTTGDNNRYLNRVLVFAGHEVEGFQDFYINEDRVQGITAAGVVTTVEEPDGTIVADKYGDNIRINIRNGLPNQTAIQNLINETPDWTSEHRLSGLACAYVRYDFDADIFPNGVPELRCIIRGKKVLDIRTGEEVFTSNPALLIRDYLVSSYGLSEPTESVDEELFKAAADVCDELDLKGNPKFTCNGAFVTSVTPYDILSDLLTCCGGLLWYAQGKWRLKPAHWVEPSLSYNEDDLRSSISLSTRHSRRDNYNSIRGTFRGPETNWQVSDFGEVTDHTAITIANGYEQNLLSTGGAFEYGEFYIINTLGTTDWNEVNFTEGVTYSVGDVVRAVTIGSGTGDAFLTENRYLITDNNQVSTIDLELPFTTTSFEAQRIARISLERNRHQKTFQASFGLRGFKAQVGDNINISNTRFGWVNKPFEVVQWTFGLTGDQDLQVQMTLRETGPEIFGTSDDDVQYAILLSGDMQTDVDGIALSGDAQFGDDKLEISGV